jgi:hypothetical protein
MRDISRQEHGGGKMRRVQSSQFGRHRLRRALEHDLIEFDELQGRDEPEDGRSARATSSSDRLARNRSRSSVRRLSVEINALAIPRSI